MTVFSWLAGLTTSWVANRVAWIDSNNVTTVLTDGTIYQVLLDGLDGRWMPPHEYITDEFYLRPGDSFRYAHTKPRDIVLPMMVKGTSLSNVTTNIRALQKKFNATLGEGTLVFYDSASRTFVLRCQYVGGMSFDESIDNTNCSRWAKFQVQFRASDPYFYDPAKKSATLPIGSALNVTNNGDVPTWPYITVTGPSGSNAIVSIKFTNNSLSGSPFFQVGSMNLTTGQHLDINFQPTERSVVLNDTTDFRRYVTATTKYFSLQSGINNIGIIASGGTTGATATIYWYEKYNGV